MGSTPSPCFYEVDIHNLYHFTLFSSTLSCGPVSFVLSVGREHVTNNPPLMALVGEHGWPPHHPLVIIPLINGIKPTVIKQ